MDSQDDVAGAVSSFDIGSLTSAIFAMGQQLAQLASTLVQAVLPAVRDLVGILNLIESLRDELYALHVWENEGGNFA